MPLDDAVATEPQPQFLFQDVQRMVLSPGDTIVLKVPGRVSDQQAQFIKNLMQDKFPGHEVLILDGGMELGLLSPKEAA